MTRTKRRTLTFGRTFTLEGVDRSFPPGDFILRVRHTQQMIDGKAQHALRRKIAVNSKIGCLPSCQPASAVFGDHACHVLNRPLGMTARRLARLTRIPGGVQGDDPIEPVCFT